MTITESPITAQLQKDGYQFAIDPSRSQEFPQNWKLANPEGLLVPDIANLVVVNFAADVATPVADLVDFGFGRRIVSSVPGRDEDSSIQLDHIAQTIAEESLKKMGDRYGISMEVLTEHGEGHFFVGDKRNVQIYGALDPIDNSDEYNRGLDTPPHVALGLYGLDRQPLAAVDINLFTRHITICRDGRNFTYNPNKNTLTEIEPLRRDKVTTVRQREFTLATYMGRRQYVVAMNRYFRKMFEEDRHEKSTLHGKGGAHLGPYFANHGISEYFMFDEPRGEVDPYVAFAKAAGYQIGEINLETAEWSDYGFDPQKSLNKETVPLFGVFETVELRDEAIEEYKSAAGIAA